MTVAPTFIVSTGRCGSTLLSQMLSRHQDVLSLSEFFMAVNTRAFVHRRLDGRKFWKLLSRPRASMSRILTPETCPQEFKYDFGRSRLFTQETLPPILYMTLPELTSEPEQLFFEMEAAVSQRPVAPLAAQYDFLFDWLRRRLGKKVVIERSGASLIFLDALLKLYPDARIIHLHRNGCDVALSMQRYPPLRLLAQSWASARRAGVDLLTPPFRIGDSRIIAFAEDYLAPNYGLDRRLREKVDVEVLGAFWSAMVISGVERMATLPPAQKMTVRYDDLAQRPHETLRNLAAFVDGDLVCDKWIDAAARIAVPSRKPRAALPASDYERLLAACRPGMAALGYDEVEDQRACV